MNKADLKLGMRVNVSEDGAEAKATIVKSYGTSLFVKVDGDTYTTHTGKVVHQSHQLRFMKSKGLFQASRGMRSVKLGYGAPIIVESIIE